MSVEYSELSPNSRTRAEGKQVLLVLLLMTFLKKTVNGSFSEMERNVCSWGDSRMPVD